MRPSVERRAGPVTFPVNIGLVACVPGVSAVGARYGPIEPLRRPVECLLRHGDGLAALLDGGVTGDVPLPQAVLPARQPSFPGVEPGLTVVVSLLAVPGDHVTAVGQAVPLVGGAISLIGPPDAMVEAAPVALVGGLSCLVPVRTARHRRHSTISPVEAGPLTETSRRRGRDLSVANSKSPSELIDDRIEELGDWRGEMLSRLRAIVKEADPDVVEEWKWRGVPTWEHDGIICTGETYKSVVKMTFAKGAALEDPAGLFNSSVEGDTRRAIDFHEGEEIDEEALKDLVRAAVALNESKRRK